MNLIDVLLILIILMSVYNGFKRGFIIGALELGSWIAGLAFALWSYQYVSGWLEKLFPNLGVWTMPLAFILALIFARIILSLIVNRILLSTPAGAHTNVANRALGVVPGFVNGVIFAAIIATLLLVFPFADGLSTKMRESTVANQLTGQVEKVEAMFAPVFDDAIKRSMTKLTVEPKSEKSIKLPFTVDDPKVREDLEAQMLVLVNEERQKEGLRPLEADPEIQVPARAHSVDMFARGYFSHVNPDGKDPFDRIRAAKVRFISAGENLALAQTLKIAHNGLMNSPGHRANILHKSFGRVGIGILDGGMYGLMITQNFRN
ncbi:MAG: hypothetical protein JWQ96_2194 [Segetibacter sp.]|nr:hypothetical protein [Segetibacter sp.]